MERYLRPSEVARMLKLNTETIYHYIKKGDLPAAKLGRKYIVTERDLERFIERRKGAHRVEKLGLSEKGKEMVEQARLASERIEDFLDEFPGATEKEIAEALDIDARDVERTLHRLEGKGQIRREGEGSKAGWYPDSEGK
jgi:excisionase family DNA binding protein